MGIINLKKGDQKYAIDEFCILMICEQSEQICRVGVFGIQESLHIDIPYEEMLEIFEESRKKDRYSDGITKIVKQDIRSEVITVGKNKFSLFGITYEFKDGENKSIRIDANFPVKNEQLQMIVEWVPGVEKYCDFSSTKYCGIISVGKIFDLEDVMKNVQEKITDFLSEVYS